MFVDFGSTGGSVGPGGVPPVGPVGTPPVGRVGAEVVTDGAPGRTSTFEETTVFFWPSRVFKRPGSRGSIGSTGVDGLTKVGFGGTELALDLVSGFF